MENISLYLAACPKLGIPNSSTFKTLDLYEEKDLFMVLSNLDQLKFLAMKNDNKIPITETQPQRVQSPLRSASFCPGVVQQRIGNDKKAFSLISVVPQKVTNLERPSTPPPHPSRPSVSSLNDDLHVKEEFKYSTVLESYVKEWMIAVVDGAPNEQPTCHSLLDGVRFADALKSGVLLCRLLNALKPGTVPRVNTSNANFAKMENISSYLKACTAIGLPSTECFNTVDLFEEKNLTQVIANLHALARFAYKNGLTKHAVHESTNVRTLYSQSLIDCTFEEVTADATVDASPIPQSHLEILNWVNSQLKKVDLSATNIGSDMRSGVKLLKLFEALCHEPLGVYAEHPTILWQYMQNASVLVSSVTQRTFARLDCCSAQDVVTGNADNIFKLLSLLRDKYDVDYYFDKLLNEGQANKLSLADAALISDMFQEEPAEDKVTKEANEREQEEKQRIQKEKEKAARHAEKERLRLEREREEQERRRIECEEEQRREEREEQEERQRQEEKRRQREEKRRREEQEERERIARETEAAKQREMQEKARLERDSREKKEQEREQREKAEREDRKRLKRERREREERERQEKRQREEQERLERKRLKHEQKERERAAREAKEREEQQRKAQLEQEEQRQQEKLPKRKHRDHRHTWAHHHSTSGSAGRESSLAEEGQVMDESPTTEETPVKEHHHRRSGTIAISVPAPETPATVSPKVEASPKTDTPGTPKSHHHSRSTSSIPTADSHTPPPLPPAVVAEPTFPTPPPPRRHPLVVAADRARLLQAQSAVRGHVARELLSTEESYMKSLVTVAEYIITPVQQASILTKAECESVFSNWQTLTNLHKTVLKELVACVSHWSMLSSVAPTITHHLEDFNLYATYLANYSGAVVAMHYLTKQNPKFNDIVEYFETLQLKESQLDLTSFLVMPVQRLPRYLLLLHTMLKYTHKSHPDYLRVTQAYDQLNALISRLNDKIDSTRGINARKLVQLAQSIEGADDKQPLVVANRILLREGVVDVKLERGSTTPKDAKPPHHHNAPYLFLFNDLLVYCDQAKKPKDGCPFCLLDVLNMSHINNVVCTEKVIHLYLRPAVSFAHNTFVVAKKPSAASQVDSRQASQSVSVFDWVLQPRNVEEKKLWEDAIMQQVKAQATATPAV
eukprot:TRINITY_DN1611_c0_g1_i1.p1 TRINITY_DN1611_c0_g1~~TRINITY_DN1611_c0_g1_i1.p1  ORF type:complete len:1342 (-),score=426.01 TRINITY_DN1611_c0_g1_i1:75-3509(-)